MMTLYGAGGCGINLVSRFNQFKSPDSSNFAPIRAVFMDTSQSNVLPILDRESLYLFEGLDGSGKKRDTNYQTISERSKELLHRFKPSDVNVVVHSASGGSGSVIGPVLVSELLSRKVPTIVIMVGSTDSRIEQQNTLKTLQSYEMISQKRGTPVIAVYQENSEEIPRHEVDQRVQTVIMLLSTFYSGKNRELDSSDLRNFLNYHEVTTFKPKLSYLDFFSKDIVLGRDEAVVSAVTLTDDQTPSILGLPVEYQAVGFLNQYSSDKANDVMKFSLPIHAAVISGKFISVVQQLEKAIDEMETARHSVIEKSILTQGLGSTDEGLIL